MDARKSEPGLDTPANIATLRTRAHFRAATFASEGQRRRSLELVFPFEEVEHFENVIIPVMAAGGRPIP
jgi:hypothetical protein